MSAPPGEGTVPAGDCPCHRLTQSEPQKATRRREGARTLAYIERGFCSGHGIQRQDARLRHGLPVVARGLTNGLSSNAKAVAFPGALALLADSVDGFAGLRTAGWL